MIAALLLFLQLTNYAQFTTVLVAPNLNAKTNLALGANIYTQCINDPAIPLEGNLFFDPYQPAQFYRVRVWYSDMSMDEVVTDAMPSPAGLSAFYLGISGDDIVGQNNQTSGNGIPDLHIQLRGLAAIPIRIQLLGDPTGLWEMPFNGGNWVIIATYGKPVNAIERCNSLAIYELTKDCIVRYQGLWGELSTGKIRSQKTLNERLKFYQIDQWPPGAPGITLP